MQIKGIFLIHMQAEGLKISSPYKHIHAYMDACMHMPFYIHVYISNKFTKSITSGELIDSLIMMQYNT